MSTTYPGELEVDGPPVSLAPPVGPKSQVEDLGEVDKEGGHLYECIKMFYKEDLLSRAAADPWDRACYFIGMWPLIFLSGAWILPMPSPISSSLH